jgi:endonuclease/exonuclease/phosphatase family metal-dependent hydrolase
VNDRGIGAGGAARLVLDGSPRQVPTVARSGGAGIEIVGWGGTTMSHWWRVVTLWGLLAACVLPLHAQDEGDALRVMSFNVRLGVADDGDNSWEHRKGLLAKTVQDFDPDLLGTQETWDFQAKYLLDRLPGRAYVGWDRQPGSDDGEQCGILYRTARFEKLDAGQFWLSEAPEVPGSKSWDSSLPRVVTWVELRDRTRPGGTFVFFNTHFDHRGSDARRESARLLRRRLGALGPDAAWILTGDFNCAEASPPYQILVRAGGGGLRVVDSYRTVHPRRSDDEGTFGAFRGNRSGGRIDWVLHSVGFDTVSAAIDRSHEGGRYPSDHYPVTAVLRWRER